MQDAVIDACCLINLIAAGPRLIPTVDQENPTSRSEPISIHRHLGVVLHVPSAVARETIFVFRPGEKKDLPLVKGFVDLASHFRLGVLNECDCVGAEEEALFVRFARDLDDGGAMCLSIAKCRDWTFASDDRKANKIAGRSGVRILTTPELLMNWAKNSKTSDNVIREVIGNIQLYARFIPRGDAPEAHWWYSHSP